MRIDSAEKMYSSHGSIGRRLLAGLACVLLSLGSVSGFGRDEAVVRVNLERAEPDLQRKIAAIKKAIARAAEGKQLLSDGELQRKALLVHALLWKYYHDPRTNMVYTIIEPHTGQVILPTREEVLNSIPNANGWSTCIEDCAGYGNGKHLAWLLVRHSVTRKPEHAEEARWLFRGLCTLGSAREGDEPFREIVRGVLPDGKTYYRGKYTGSSGDNYNGYCYAMWRYYHSPIAIEVEKQQIRRIMRLTCYRGGGAFAAITGEITGDAEFTDRYHSRKARTIEKLAAMTTTEDKPSWTAIQRQLHYRALFELDPDPLCKRVYRHAMRANAWGRYRDVIVGLKFNPDDDRYPHRVRTVRNPLDGLLTVMLSGERDIIEAFMPLFRAVAARYDFRAFRDQRQLTPYLGAYWLAVKHGFLKYNPSIPPPENVTLTPLDPRRNLVVTYFADCNPRAWRVKVDMRYPPEPPNWSSEIRNATASLRNNILRIDCKEGGCVRYRAISAPWVRDVSAEKGYSIRIRARVLAGRLHIAFADGAREERFEIFPEGARLMHANLAAEIDARRMVDYELRVRGAQLVVTADGRRFLTGAMTRKSDRRSLCWGMENKGSMEIREFKYVTGERFKYPKSDTK